MAMHRNYTAISDFRLLNRRTLMECSNVTDDPSLKIKVSQKSNLADEEYLRVTVSRVLHPSETDWVAMISPSHSNVESCPPNVILYLEIGDFANLPLLCHYLIKAMYMSKDPDYLSCKNKHRNKYRRDKGIVTSCRGTLTFHVINIITDIEFVFFGGGIEMPCVLARSHPINFANPNKPLYGHISSVDSTGTSMRLTWVSGAKEPQQYGDRKTLTSQVTTFTQDNMCNSSNFQSPAKDFGWHDPGYIHSAAMTGLEPSSNFSYRYGSDSAGWSEQIQFRTPPAGGSDELRFIAYGDMGKAPRDASAEHFIQPGSLSVIDGIADEVDSNKVDSIFHIGDISYVTGFLVEWDFFLQQISPVASRVSYMTTIGNYERFFVILLTFLLNPSPSSSWSLHPSHINSMAMYRNHIAISNFRLLNRRTLMECSNATDPSIKIKVSHKSNLADEEYLTVTVSRVLHPTETDWVAMISPSHSNVESCQDYSFRYMQTGDFDDLPLLCHYPVKAMFMSKDPDYLSCKKKHHKKSRKSKVGVTSCRGELTFHVINIRTDIKFVFFVGGFDAPCVLARTHCINFANPKKPLHGHISTHVGRCGERIGSTRSGMAHEQGGGVRLLICKVAGDGEWDCGEGLAGIKGGVATVLFGGRRNNNNEKNIRETM
ncbi:hypothetical protein FH972_010853 [Carpinus fangiana]|uniref:Purple acid phosphatase N-terminal domain-containing protein n=1 Tax=Carpinus fangiana TaxID=176857 RepID=A0A660KRJ3_9ROSI|nr:hypothetical protein FH972_010853 [Carpinus fangiana]